MTSVNQLPITEFTTIFKMVGESGPPLGEPFEAFERGALIVPHSVHHEDVLPIVMQYPLLPQYNPISDEYLQVTLPIEGLVVIPEVKENPLDYLLPH